MKITLQQGITKSLIGVAATGAFMFMPALGTVSAQADPPAHAPAYGRRAKDKHRYKDQNKYKHQKGNKDWDRYDRDNRNNHYQTITGVVTNDRRGDEFNVRMSNGRTIRVDANRREPRRLSEGDRVRVYGRYVNNVFSASDIVITANRNRDNRDRYNRDRDHDYRNDRNRDNDYRSYTGVVTNVRSNNEFDIRADGTIYNVTLSQNAPRRLDRNDYVRVYGKRMGENNINNANVSVLQDR